jgi:hypothetical protein
MKRKREVIALKKILCYSAAGERKRLLLFQKCVFRPGGPETFEITFSPHAKTALEIKRRAGSFLSQSARESFRAVNGKTISQLFAKLFKALARSLVLALSLSQADQIKYCFLASQHAIFLTYTTAETPPPIVRRLLLFPRRTFSTSLCRQTAGVKNDS